MNQGMEPDMLTRSLLESCGLDHPNKLIALFHSPETGRRFWAQQARHVVAAAEAGHDASRKLIEQAGKDLADLTVQVLRQLGLYGPVILGGGLGTNVRLLQEAFRDGLALEGISDVRAVEQEPVFGVLQLLAEQG
jgi:N-acetylglucosamine kinase-like BadF-type ATPase